MARLQARMYDHGCDYTYDVPHSRWRILFYDSAHGQTLSNPHRATNRWRATDFKSVCAHRAKTATAPPQLAEVRLLMVFNTGIRKEL